MNSILNRRVLAGLSLAAAVAIVCTLSVRAQLRPGLGSASAAVRSMPLANHAQGQQMMAEAAKNASLLDINFTFLNKNYEDDKYVREPITGKKVRTACVRFRATSGFRLKIDMPQFSLTPQGLTISQNISRIAADGIKVKVQLGPCVESTTGAGIRVSDVKVTYKARPTLSFDQNNVCKLTWNQDPEDMRVSIGDFNITGVQNDLDKLAKDAVREGINATLNGFYGTLVRRELEKITFNVCGKVKAGD